MLGVAFCMTPVTTQVVSANSDQGKLQIRAEVLPAQSIVLNDAGEIVQILSNTNQIATPRVFKGSVDASNRLPLTTVIYQKYRALIPAGSERIGVLYSKPIDAPLSRLQSYLVGTSVLGDNVSVFAKQTAPGLVN